MIFCYVYVIVFIHSSINGQSGCFQLLAVLNNAAKDRCQCEPFFRLLVGHVQSIIAGSYGNPVFTFLKNRYTALHTSFPNFVYFVSALMIHKYSQNVLFYNAVLFWEESNAGFKWVGISSFSVFWKSSCTNMHSSVIKYCI